VTAAAATATVDAVGRVGPAGAADLVTDVVRAVVVGAVVVRAAVVGLGAVVVAGVEGVTVAVGARDGDAVPVPMAVPVPPGVASTVGSSVPGTTTAGAEVDTCAATGAVGSARCDPGPLTRAYTVYDTAPSTATTAAISARPGMPERLPDHRLADIARSIAALDRPSLTSPAASTRSIQRLVNGWSTCRSSQRIVARRMRIARRHVTGALW
jgi:hypothetical protein